jgi:preprotein translocase subunit YajC
MTQTIQAFMLPLAFLAIFYLFIIRPQKKKEKEIKEMRSQLAVGDRVVTIGGIVGRITRLKDDEVTIEVGADRTKMVMKKWAIGTSDKEKSAEVTTESKTPSEDETV